MDVGKEKITPVQLALLTSGFILGSSLLISFMDDMAKQDAWLVILTAYFVSIPFVLSYASLAKRFSGKNFVEINDIVYGPYLGKLITVLYLGTFFYLLSLNILDLADFYTGYIMPETPSLVFLAVFGLVCAYAVKKGLETIARISLFSVIFTFIIVIGTILLLLGNIDLSNFLPVFEVPADEFIHSTHIFATIPFCEIFVFMMIFPNLNQPQKTGKYSLIGFSVAFLGMLMISLRSTAVLGPSAGIYTNVAFEAVSLINTGEVLTRIELFVAIGITLALFIKVCVLYYATTTCMAQLFRLRSGSVLIIPVGIIAVVLCPGMFCSLAEHKNNGADIQPIYLIFYEFIIPPLSLLIAKIRKLPNQERGKSV